MVAILSYSHVSFFYIFIIKFLNTLIEHTHDLIGFTGFSVVCYARHTRLIYGGAH